MANNVYEGGESDARQSDDAELTPTLFRTRYRKLNQEEVDLHDAIKKKADELAALIESIPGGANSHLPSQMVAHLSGNKTANKVLALRHLEDAVYRGVKALTS